MPLRKRHVRRIVAAGLAVLVLGALGTLAIWGVWFRRGGYDRALVALLESHLRCRATVAGARPTGLGAAEAAQVALAWEAAGGRLVLSLSRLTAKSGERSSPPGPDAAGAAAGGGLALPGAAGPWDVAAEAGDLRLEGPRPLEVLSALNQRLVQAEGRLPVQSLRVEALRLALETDRLAVTDLAQVEADTNKKGFIAVRFMRRSAPGGKPSEAPDAVLNLKPASPEGIFNGFTADVGGFPAHRVVLKGTRRGRPGAENAGGLIDLDVDWPAAGRKAVYVELSARGLALTDWTAAMPGGPVAGSAELVAIWRRPPAKPGELEVRLTVRQGRLSAEALRWLEGLPAGLCAAAGSRKEPLDFEALAIEIFATGDRARFAARADLFGRIPLVEGRLFGRPVPLVWASPRPFDAAALERAVLDALAPPGKALAGPGYGDGSSLRFDKPPVAPGAAPGPKP